MRGVVAKWIFVGIALASGCDEADLEAEDDGFGENVGASKADDAAPSSPAALPSSCEEAGELGACSLFGQCRVVEGRCVEDPCWTRSTQYLLITWQDLLTGRVFGSCHDPEPTGFSLNQGCATLDETFWESSTPEPGTFVSTQGTTFETPKGWGQRTCCKSRGQVNFEALCGLPLAAE